MHVITAPRLSNVVEKERFIFNKASSFVTVYFHELEKLVKFQTGMCFVCYVGKKGRLLTGITCRKWSNWVGDSDKLHKVFVC